MEEECFEHLEGGWGSRARGAPSSQWGEDGGMWGSWCDTPEELDDDAWWDDMAKKMRERQVKLPAKSNQCIRTYFDEKRVVISLPWILLRRLFLTPSVMDHSTRGGTMLGAAAQRGCTIKIRRDINKRSGSRIPRPRLLRPTLCHSGVGSTPRVKRREPPLPNSLLPLLLLRSRTPSRLSWRGALPTLQHGTDSSQAVRKLRSPT